MGKIPASIISTPFERRRKPDFASFARAPHLPLRPTERILTMPRHNPVVAFTMGGIVRDAGLSVNDISQASLSGWLTDVEADGAM